MTDVKDDPRFDKLYEMFGDPNNPPELDPELVPWIEETDTMVMLRHPLVYCIMYTPSQNKLLNKQLEQKKKAIAKAESEGEWSTVILMHEKPYRLMAFGKISWFLSDEEYWQLLAAIWSITENLWQNQDEWIEFLLSDRPGRDEWFMDDDEKTLYAALPPVVTVYRGFDQVHGWRGPSWTLSRETAEWFANRILPEKPSLAIAEVSRDLILACLEGRGEKEVVIADLDAINVRTMKLI